MNPHPLFSALRATVIVCGSVCASVSALGQSLEWSGGNLATSNGWGSGTAGVLTNWVGNVLPTAGSPVAINVATGNFTPPAPNSADAMAFGGQWTITSITFNNAAGQFPALLRLNANFGAGSTTRNQTLLTDAEGMLINVINQANVLISANSSVTPLTTFVGSNLNLNFTGMGRINVDGTSSLTIGGNATNFKAVAGQNAGLNKTGAGSLTLGGGASNYLGGFTLSEGTLFVVGSSNTTVGAVNYGFGPFGNGGTLTLHGGTKLASSATSVSGNRTLDYPVVFTGGTVTLGDTTNDGVLLFTSVAHTGNITFSGHTVVNVLSPVTFNRSLDGAGALTKTGPGNLNLFQPATHTGGTILQGGQLQISDSPKLPVGGNVTFDGGTYRAAGTTSYTANYPTIITSSGATFNIAGGINLNWAGNITGPGGLSTAGSGLTGMLTLSGVNTYGGPTSVTAGKLRVTGSVTSPVTIASGSDLSGTGHLMGAVTIAGTHSPGTSAGIQRVGRINYDAGAAINWELLSNTATQGDPAATFDQVLSTGTVDFVGATALHLSFNSSGSTVEWSDPFWLQARSWVVVDAAVVANFSNLSVHAADWADSIGATLLSVHPAATFSLSQSGGQVLLNYAPAPVSVDPYTAWRNEYFTAAELELAGVSGALADPDGDGLANLLEYALGLQPREVDAAAIPAATSADGFWVFHYTRPLSRTDVSYAVEVSTNLQTWSTANVQHEQVAVAGDTATWRARYSQAGAPAAFFRLRVTPAAP